MATAQQTLEVVEQTQRVAEMMRGLIAERIPTSNSECFTITLPGTLLDFSENGNFSQNASSSAESQDIANARLVDRMVPLALVSAGLSTRSVARSYFNALEELVPTKTASQLEKVTPSSADKPVEPQKPAEIEKSRVYDNAMTYLRSLPSKAGGTTTKGSVNAQYQKLQLEYSKAKGEWDDAQAKSNEYKSQLKRDGKHASIKDTEYRQSLLRIHRDTTKAAYIDWVVNGRKFEVDHYVAIVDTMTVMSRIEASKEAMRNAMIQSDDGMEFYRVHLQPPTWVSLCRGKTDEFDRRVKGESTVELDEKRENDTWVKITGRITRSDQLDEAKASSTSAQAIASHGDDPFFSPAVDVSTSHSNMQKEAQKELAQCDVLVSMSVMKVEIARPWLHLELFHDHELDLPEYLPQLSPGPSVLKQLINDGNVESLEPFGEFASIPTAMMIATDVELEFTGACSKMSEFLSSSENAASLKIGYGPFSLGASDRTLKSKQKLQTSTTGNGLKISIGSPQIIGWVHELMPQLPKPVRGKL